MHSSSCDDVTDRCGDISPLAGQTVLTRGVVVGDFEGPSHPAWLLHSGPGGDGNDLTSDGLFVFNGNANAVFLGAVAGTVAEFQGQTQLSATSVTACGSGTIVPVDVSLPAQDEAYFERFEGMLVHLPQELTVTEHFQLGRFGQVVVSSGERLRQPRICLRRVPTRMRCRRRTCSTA